MSNTAQEIYNQVIRDLPPNERLRLANLILNDLVQNNLAIIDESDTWTEQDQIDLTSFSLQYASTNFPESEEIA
ncbi:hypothetical protein ACQFX9_18550 [Aliinostoc sp. HNIBRCY26]|uniref:hypothetical protein n=1 Tax=Aliinostoc sp. HNIBRCY26 TaxID=3418997 RepID=UPI003D00A7D1